MKSFHIWEYGSSVGQQLFALSLLLRQCLYRLDEREHHQANAGPLPGQRGHSSEDHTQVRSWLKSEARVVQILLSFMV